MSFYRPENYETYRTSTHDLPPPPPPPPEMPPLPRGPPPLTNIYHGGDSWRPSNREPNISQRNEFTFRNNDTAPQYPRVSDQYRPTRSRDYAMRENEHVRSDNQDRAERSRKNRGRRDQMNLNRNQRGRSYRIATAERPLLRLKRGDTPEQMLGMTEEHNGARHFLPADDVSDSGEEQMDESDSDQDRIPLSTARQGDEAVLLSPEVAKYGVIEDTLEPPSKKRALGAGMNRSKEENATPKWSNPDPYTVLPPVDESQRKRKDVVKIIRKARIMSEKEAIVHSQVVANDDFISFDLDEEASSADEAIHSLSDGKDLANGIKEVVEAPKGPRQSGHIHDLPLEPAYTPNDAPSALHYINHTAPPLSELHDFKAEHSDFKFDTPDYDIPEYDTALGNRKRTYDDEIKSEFQYTKKRKPGSEMPNGSIVQDWIPVRGTNPMPWLVRSDRLTEKTGFRLHKEICDFYEFVRPQKYEQTVREELLDRLQATVKSHLPHCNIHCFGSFAAGLYLPNADMDLVVNSDQFTNLGQKVACQTNSQMHKFGRYLTDSRTAMAGSVEVITGAKVPIIKFIDRITAIKVDVSFENETGLEANKTFSAWKKQFPAMPILVTLIKQFLMMRGLNEVMNGGLGGFSVTCLVTSMLQNMPRVQAGELVPERHLGEMLVEFLDLYGNRLDITRTGIMMNPPGYFNKHERLEYRKGVYQAHKADRLAIMDPNKPDNDVSGGSRNVTMIFDRFSRAHRELLAAMQSANRPSLLDWFLGGNYEVFVWQRNHLRCLYTERWGDPDQYTEELQGSIHDSTTYMAVGNYSAKQGISSLKPNTFTIQGGVNPFPERTPSTTNTVKLNPRKVNHYMGNNKFKAPKPKSAAKGKVKTQIQLPTTSPPVLAGEDVTKKNAQARAAALKRDYPGIKGVGDSITKKKRQKLITQHKVNLPGVAAHIFTPDKKSKNG